MSMSISISCEVQYTISVKQYTESISEVILCTDSYARALQELLIEAPFNYQVSIHDQTDTLLLLYQDCVPIYRHDILNLPPREMEDTYLTYAKI